MQRATVFIVIVLIVTINVVFGLMLTSKVVGPGFTPPPEAGKQVITKTANIQTATGSGIDFWEYKSGNLSCLISVHVYTTQGSFTQISCTK